MTDVPRALADNLKEFQRRTVDFVSEQLYGSDATDRFLVADEVGLGKTLVARGIIAKAIEYLSETTKRVDVIYVCSNSAIAKQNIKRLIPAGYGKAFPITSRLTYLPADVQLLRDNPVNFISFTPATTFDHTRSRGGQSRERVILYHLLAELRVAGGFRLGCNRGLLNLLQATSGQQSWGAQVAALNPATLDPDLGAAFRTALRGDDELCAAVEEGCSRFQRYRENSSVPREDSDFRYDLIAKLRRLLAAECLSALEPDLVILDEFQRFKDLLDGENDAAELARSLFEYPGVKLLLLSATPYKMYSLDQERDEDDHHPDFLRTLSFLFGNSEKVAKVQGLMSEHRRALQSLGGNGPKPDLSSKRQLEELLSSVMCRTERVGMTHNNDSMLENTLSEVYPTAFDIRDAAAVGAVAHHLEVGDQVEFWKSAPYPLNFMGRYELRRRLQPELADPPKELQGPLRAAVKPSLKKAVLEGYGHLDPANARLRGLMDDTIGQDMWQLLWMPPSLPYHQPGGVFRGKEKLTKALVFSSWSAVPEAIAALCSYEAEKRMVEGAGIPRSELHIRTKALLRFAVSSVDGRLTGMPVIAWLMPSPRLATEVDPLRIALSSGPEPMNAELLRAEAKVICERLVATLPASRTEGRVDEAWYWAAPILLETNRGLLEWCRSRSGWKSAASDPEAGTSFHEHIDRLVRVANGEEELGPKPDDLADVLCDIALGAPGVLALRALLRLGVCPEATDPALLSSAARIAEGFRTLFNMPESILLLRGTGEETYWRLALRYAIDGNLQAVLDEHVHVLRESLGLQGSEPAEQVAEISNALAGALGLRTAQVSVDGFQQNAGGFTVESFNVRSRFAMRFARFSDAEGALVRAESVRDAFNSPFRPFVLASTSIGQEGLDFHTWCHAVVHWNLPSNPVDLEQREGRVHRYKGHAVRKNIAEHYGLTALQRPGGWSDPWQSLFELAATEAGDDGLGLIPYWVFERGSARIERRVPLMPYSREVGKLEALKNGLALYRLVFGQPRQEDLMSILSVGTELDAAGLADWLISLTPPARTPSEGS